MINNRLEIAQLEKQIEKSKKPKKTLTPAQQKALAIGRIKARQKQAERQYQQALQLQLRVKSIEESPITMQQFEARIRYVQREFKLTRTEAIKKITTSRMFRAPDELFKMAIKSYASLTDFTKIRSYIWQILKEENPDAVAKGWITYQTTKINWDEFVYSDFLKTLVYSRNGRKIIITVKKGKDSLDPDWLDIRLI